MRETTPSEFSTLAADESLAYALEAERLDAELQDLYANRGHRGDLIGRANARLGIALKLAGVHAELAVAEQVLGLRKDLAPLVADFTAIPDLVQDVTGQRVVQLLGDPQ